MLRAVTFGQCAFETSQVRIAPDSEIHFAILLVIAAAPPEGILRDELVACIWPRADDEERRHRLRQAMYRLRQLDVPVHLRGGSVVLDWERCALDVHLLLHGTPPRELLVRLGAVPFLPAYAPNLGEPLAHWLEALRARVATRLRRALSDEVTSTRGRARFHEMGQVARALLALDPLNEVGTLGLAEALALEGSKVEALRLLEDYEEEVGAISADLQLPARILRRRVAEVLDDSLVLRRFELPFIGREREFQVLRQLLREVRGGDRHAAIITGEAGVGKSRLAGELLRLAALDGVTIATYTPSAGDTFTPVSTLVTVGQLLLTLPGALGCAQEHLHYVRHLGTPETVTVWSVTGMAADILYAQLVQALAELVMAIADEAPLVLFVDDAERLHPTTWRVLMDVWDRVETRPVCFLFAARRLPPAYGSLGAPSCERLTQHVRLAPFANDDSLLFVQRWGERNRVVVDEEAALRVATLSSGNPFYLSELVAHLGRGGDPQQTPPSIRDLIGAQHDVLSREARRVLLVVAILETRATTTRAVRLLEMPANDFMAAMDELQGAGLVATKGPVVWCRHRMVAALASELEVPSIVAFAHARAAAMLEGEADASQSVELLGDCVTHWEEAGEVRKAYEAAMKLGYRLVALGMGDEACKAFAAARRCSETDDDLLPALEGSIAAARLCANWSDVKDFCSERSEVRARLSLSVSSHDEYDLFHAEACMLLFDQREWPGRLSSILESRESTSGFRLRAATLQAMLGDNDYDEDAIRSAASSALEAIDSSDVTELESTLFRLVYDTTVGDAHRVRDHALKYANLSRASEEIRQQIHGLRRSANALVRVGLHDVARPLLEETLALATKYKLQAQQFATSDVLLTSYLLCGEVDLGVVELTRQREICSRNPTETLHVLLRYSESVFAWLTNDVALARTLYRQMPPTRRFPLMATQYCVDIGDLALRLLISQHPTTRRETIRLHAQHMRGRSFGRQDINTRVLSAAFRSIGADKAAQKLEAEYASVRREITVGPFTFAQTEAKSIKKRYK
ncbi:MAG: AAA family ATPase [Gemmatimonadaceae bacterium]|nr:AAA family ATPase [Gemmatimonadaceae bacterium]